MSIKKETERKIQDLQVFEQNLQQILMQKQSIQLELSESENALNELKSSDGEAYRIIGGIMMKSDRKKLIAELEEKKKISELRINSIEKQEKLLDDRASSLRNEVKSEIEHSEK